MPLPPTPKGSYPLKAIGKGIYVSANKLTFAIAVILPNGERKDTICLTLPEIAKLNDYVFSVCDKKDKKQREKSATYAPPTT